MNELNQADQLTAAEAKAQGYHQLTTEYHLPSEAGLLARAVADLERGQMPYVLVKRKKGIEIWRKGRKAT